MHRGRGRRRLPLIARAAALAAGFAVLGWASTAMAHPVIDEARMRYAEARFERALGLLEQAEHQEQLSRTDILALLELRVLVHAAMGQRNRVEESLAALATIDPGYRFSSEVPPDIVEDFRAIASRQLPLELAVQTEATPSGTRIHASTLHDDGHIVTAVRIRGRADDAPSWRESTTGELDVPAFDDLEYYVEAIGPGRSVVATLGNEQEPLRGGSGAATGPQTDPGLSPWPFVAAGAAVLVASAIIAIVVASDDDVAVTEPIIRF